MPNRINYQQQMEGVLRALDEPGSARAFCCTRAARRVPAPRWSAWPPILI